MEAAKRGHLLPVFVPAPSEVVWENLEIAAAGDGKPGADRLEGGGGLFHRRVGRHRGGLDRDFDAGAVRADLQCRGHHPTAFRSSPRAAAGALAGTGPQVQITIAALASQFPMLVGTMQGLQAADSRQRETDACPVRVAPADAALSADPSALPYLFAGFKIAAPSAVLGAITAEWAGADRGVGAMMLYALFSYDTPKVWLSVVLTCLLAGAGFGIWVAVERVVVYWRHDVELAD